LKDDKAFPFVAIDRSTPFPRILKLRNRCLNRQKDVDYFGPFASSYDASQALISIQKICEIRSCTDSFFRARTRPCVLYQLRRWTAPCVGKIGVEDYAERVAHATDILSGNIRHAVAALVQVMERLRDAEDYEKAAIVRDRIRALEKLSQTNNFSI